MDKVYTFGQTIKHFEALILGLTTYIFVCQMGFELGIELGHWFLISFFVLRREQFRLLI